MLQILEWDSEAALHILGDGQAIEEDIAQALGVKIFKLRVGRHSAFSSTLMRQLKNAILTWEAGDCRSMDPVAIGEVEYLE